MRKHTKAMKHIEQHRKTYNNVQKTHKNIENIYDELIKAKNDNQLSSIRVHKYLTAGGTLGKVKTARYLDEIGLDEKTKFKNLKEADIKKLVKYVIEQ